MDKRGQFIGSYFQHAQTILTRKEESSNQISRIDKKKLLKAGMLLTGAIATSIFYFVNKEYFWTGILTIISVVIKFIRLRFKFPLEVEPTFFFALLVTREFGFMNGMIVEGLAVIAINIINFDFTQGNIIGLIKPAIVLAVGSLLSGMDIIVLGIALSVLRSIIGFVMGLMMGVPISAMFFVPFNPIVSVAYFLNLGRLMESLVSL